MRTCSRVGLDLFVVGFLFFGLAHVLLEVFSSFLVQIFSQLLADLGGDISRQLLHRQQHPPYRGLLRDYRILFTTVDRAVEEIRRFGVAVTTRRREEDDCISYTIRIPKSAKKEREPKDQLSLYA